MLRDSDLLYLQAAVELARRGEFTTTPNPRVGCLLVRDGEVLGRGWHVRHGEGHAEVNALADARAAANTTRAAASPARGATAYVSLEPCAFQGKTPPCSQALIKAGVSRVVCAMTDPHPKVAGRGFAELKKAGIEVDIAELAEARALNAGYVSRLVHGRPFVRLKVAASLDARSAMASGESQWITGEAARADVMYWRARSCAIVTGVGTVVADDPRLTVRDASRAPDSPDSADSPDSPDSPGSPDSRYAVDGAIRQPLRVVLDSQLRTPPTAAILGAPGTTLLVHAPQAVPISSAVEHLPVAADDQGLDLQVLLEQLALRKCNEVLVEAGPRVVGSFLRLGLWDELLLYQAPKLLGSDARPLAELALARMAQAIEATIVDSAWCGDDLRLRLRPAHPRRD